MEKKLINILEDNEENIIENIKEFEKLMIQYECALLEVETKFRVLNRELSIDEDSNPILSMTSRVKKAKSIMNKLKSRNIPLSLENIEKNLKDVAGLRVICAFIEDIYTLAEKIISQDDIKLLEIKDYIKNPKPNGYRSLHLILQVPVFFSNETKNMPVEVQIRTIAMDSWASLEHKIRYKKEEIKDKSIPLKLKECADLLAKIDDNMEEINKKILIERSL